MPPPASVLMVANRPAAALYYLMAQTQCTDSRGSAWDRVDYCGCDCSRYKEQLLLLHLARHLRTRSVDSLPTNAGSGNLDSVQCCEVAVGYRLAAGHSHRTQCSCNDAHPGCVRLKIVLERYESLRWCRRHSKDAPLANY